MRRFFTKMTSCVCSTSTDDNEAPEGCNSTDTAKQAKKSKGNSEDSTRNGNRGNVTSKPSKLVSISSSNQLSQGANNTSSDECNGIHMTKVAWISGDRKEVTEINWKIKDFLSICEMRELLRNELCVFTTGYSLNTPTRWCFNVQRMKNENNIGLFLERVKPLSFKEAIGLGPPTQFSLENSSESSNSPENANETIYIHYDCIIKRSGYGDVWLHKKTCIPKFEIGQRLGFRKLFTLDELKAADNGQKGVPLLSSDDYALNIDITFTLQIPATGSLIKTQLNFREKMSLENSERFHTRILQEDFGKLLKSGLNADTILITEDDQSFPVHKAVLTARSPMFAAMFQSGMRESQTNIVRIKDITSKVIESILSYIYSGIVAKFHWGNAADIQELIYAADKYSLIGLRDLCDKMLFSGCENHNAMDLLYIAQTHNLGVALRDISLFLKMNANEIFNPKISPSPSVQGMEDDQEGVVPFN